MNGSPAAGRRRILGVVLAGGESTRFGSPKWRAQVAGRSMGARALDALEPNVRRVVAVSWDPRLGELGIAVRADVEPARGPLEGIRTALSWAVEESFHAAVVLGCDLPLVSESLVGLLVSSWGGEEAVFPLGPAGPEPLCALYATTALPRVEEALAAGRRSPRHLLGELRTRVLPFRAAVAAAGCENPFLNVNTTAARAEAEMVLEARLRPAGEPTSLGL